MSSGHLVVNQDLAAADVYICASTKLQQAGKQSADGWDLLLTGKSGKHRCQVGGAIFMEDKMIERVNNGQFSQGNGALQQGFRVQRER